MSTSRRGFMGLIGGVAGLLGLSKAEAVAERLKEPAAEKLLTALELADKGAVSKTTALENIGLDWRTEKQRLDEEVLGPSRGTTSTTQPPDVWQHSDEYDREMEWQKLVDSAWPSTTTSSPDWLVTGGHGWRKAELTWEDESWVPEALRLLASRGDSETREERTKYRTTEGVDYYVSGKRSGVLRIGRIAAPKANMQRFLDRFGDVMKARDNTLRCKTISGSEVVYKHAVLSSVDLTMASGEFTVLENAQLMFTDFEWLTTVPNDGLNHYRTWQGDVRYLWQLETMRRMNEAIALEYAVPLRTRAELEDSLKKLAGEAKTLEAFTARHLGESWSARVVD